jgi:hypothetical protein
MSTNAKRVYTDINVFSEDSIRQRVFAILDKNPTLKPQEIIILLNSEPGKFTGPPGTVRTYRAQWKREYRNRHSLKCLNFHHCRGFLYMLKSVDRAAFVAGGPYIPASRDNRAFAWNISRAKNGMYVFKVAGLGRVEWFGTGRVNFWVKKPGTWGRVKTLLAYAFHRTGAIANVEVFDLWANTARFKGAHLTIDTGERLPYHRVDILKESNGTVFKMGDASHPTSFEIEFSYPNWAERLERLAENTTGLLERVVKALELTAEQQEKFNEFLGDLKGPTRKEQLGPREPGRLYE